MRVSLESRRASPYTGGVTPESFHVSLKSGPRYAIQQLQTVASKKDLSRKRYGRDQAIRNPQSVHGSVSGADRKCGKKTVEESLAAFGLVMHFLLQGWQGKAAAGSIEALALGAAAKGGGDPWFFFHARRL